MNIQKFISKTRDGNAQPKGAIIEFINNYLASNVDDAAMASWLMAVYQQGLTDFETAELTEAMIHSGTVLEPMRIKNNRYIDKHSTGGVGDKTTLIVAPLVASLGIPVMKLSGKSLGFTGGTIDKLSSIEGINLAKSNHDIERQIKEVGIYIGEQTAELAPADKRIYALRQHTATVESIPLIASSIMSKKIAGNADAYVIDVKVGNGAFMKTLDNAYELAKSMKSIALAHNKKITVVLSRMDQPLGRAVGNQLELVEAVEMLKGQHLTSSLAKLCIVLAAEMIILSEYKNITFEEAYAIAYKQLHSGKAYDTLKDMIAAQGGDLENTLTKEAEFTYDYYANQNGVITEIYTDQIGWITKMLGSGVYENYNKWSPYAGMIFNKGIGDRVFVGESILQFFYDIDRAPLLDEVVSALNNAIVITPEEEVKDIDALKNKDIIIDRF